MLSRSIHGGPERAQAQAGLPYRKGKLKQAFHIVKVGFIRHGPAARPARLVILWFGGGSKWGVGVASEGVMNCFEWDPERPAKAPLAGAKGCFE